MFRTVFRAILVLFIIASLSSSVLGAGMDVRRMMSPDQYKASGLDKLSDEEITYLNRWLTNYTMSMMSYTGSMGSGSTSYSSLPSMINPADLEGMAIVSGKGNFLGIISRDRKDPDSIANHYSDFGNPTSYQSIFNPGGSYGSRYSSWSAFNIAATSPPMIYAGGTFIAFLTANPFLYPRVDPFTLAAWVESGR